MGCLAGVDLEVRMSIRVFQFADFVVGKEHADRRRECEGDQVRW